ncbi:MAG TPA: SRPBCC family protein [Nevskia sp.]|nr:SRPBCC family protein [Nevskia sp.]
MNPIRTIVALSLAFAAGGSFAAAPQLKVSESVVINAPVATVWDRVKSFDGLNNWHPAVAADEIVAGKNDQAGAVRQLTLKDGGTIKEKLLEFSDSRHRFRYTILEGVLPVSGYTSTLEVEPAGKGASKVTWSGSFKRKDTGAKPAEGADDKAATTTISGVYRGGLDNLKTLVEAK